MDTIAEKRDSDLVIHPHHYNQHVVECQDFRRKLPAPLADAAKYIWRKKDKWNEQEDAEKVAWYIRDYITHEDEFDPLKMKTAARMAAQVMACMATMSNRQAEELLMVVSLATGENKPEALEWASEQVAFINEKELKLKEAV